jgi:hypothetical protein
MVVCRLGSFDLSHFVIVTFLLKQWLIQLANRV